MRLRVAMSPVQTFFQLTTSLHGDARAAREQRDARTTSLSKTSVRIETERRSLSQFVAALVEPALTPKAYTNPLVIALCQARGSRAHVPCSKLACGEAAVDQQGRPVDERSCRRREEEHGAAHIGGLANAAERDLAEQVATEHFVL